jgi:hypothetical protein
VNARLHRAACRTPTMTTPYHANAQLIHSALQIKSLVVFEREFRAFWLMLMFSIRAEYVVSVAISSQ